ncbi:hypothetical protein BKA62DRAFT_834320 [Auriculariales sp. MPI-PUGE-AT-0066]|nr:hypothetical protein BKA62DRAFT_834320 [Auriculariales sp. MPI-PUGE-AT-0066]
MMSVLKSETAAHELKSVTARYITELKARSRLELEVDRRQRQLEEHRKASDRAITHAADVDPAFTYARQAIAAARLLAAQIEQQHARYEAELEELQRKHDQRMVTLVQATDSAVCVALISATSAVKEVGLQLAAEQCVCQSERQLEAESDQCDDRERFEFSVPATRRVIRETSPQLAVNPSAVNSGLVQFSPYRSASPPDT